jgi:Tol biopolymer transport system component
MKPRWPSAVAVSVAVGAAALTACSPRQPWQHELVSVNADGTDSGNSSSGAPALSADGTKVAFISWATDLASGDTDETGDVYVRDLVTGSTTLVSVRADGAHSPYRHPRSVTISPDGTKVAFTTDANDLGPTDTNGAEDIYLRDLVHETTTLVSVNATGTDSGNHRSSDVTFSADGTKVAFTSQAEDLGPTDTNGGSDVYVRDLVQETTTLVSVNAAGTDSDNDHATGGIVSADGTKVVFLSRGNDFGPTDTDDFHDIYVRGLVDETTTLVSVNAAGTDSDNGGDLSVYGGARGAMFSADGTKVAFTTDGYDLGPIDTNDTSDVYVRDLVSGTTRLVSANADGTDGGNNISDDPVFSPDGTKVAFYSYASNLGPTDTNGGFFGRDVYVRDLASGTTRLVTVNAAGTDSAQQGFTGELAFSPDGTKVAFARDGVDLVEGGTDGRNNSDVYVRDLVHETTTLVSANVDGTGSGNGYSSLEIPSTPVGRASSRVFSPDGGRIVFTSSASDLGPTDHARTNDDYDVYVATLRGADLSVTGGGRA